MRKAEAEGEAEGRAAAAQDIAASSADTESRLEDLRAQLEGFRQQAETHCGRVEREVRGERGGGRSPCVGCGGVSVPMWWGRGKSLPTRVSGVCVCGCKFVRGACQCRHQRGDDLFMRCPVSMETGWSGCPCLAHRCETPHLTHPICSLSGSESRYKPWMLSCRMCGRRSRRPCPGKATRGPRPPSGS